MAQRKHIGAYERPDLYSAKSEVNWQAIAGGVLSGAGTGLLTSSGATSYLPTTDAFSAVLPALAGVVLVGGIVYLVAVR